MAEVIEVEDLLGAWMLHYLFDWLTNDKGYARKLVHLEPIQNPEHIRRIGDFPNLTAAMISAGWPDNASGRLWASIECGYSVTFGRFDPIALSADYMNCDAARRRDRRRNVDCGVAINEEHSGQA